MRLPACGCQFVVYLRQASVVLASSGVVSLGDRRPLTFFWSMPVSPIAPIVAPTLSRLSSSTLFAKTALAALNP